MADGKPCEPCPWVSRDPRDKEAIERTGAQAAMEAGAWFCCHVNMGTCFGAQLQQEKLARRSS